VHVVLAAGGTGGHIEPALTVADALVRRDPATRITVVGGERGLETTLVPARGYRLVSLPSAPLPRRPGADLVKWGPRLRRAVAAASTVLVQEQADVVVGFGGYAAGPVYLAARRARIPLVIHESNARAGMANRLGARLTSQVFSAYPGALRGAKTMPTPLRPAIARLDRAAERGSARAFFGLADDRPVLLVFGGSQGARRLNDAVAGALPALLAGGVQVLHAYGSRNEPPASAAGYVALPFVDRMDLAYAAADLALTRGGALTCAELAAVGLPAIYVPLPIGNGEQALNARPVVDAGGGMLLDDALLTPEWLTDAVLGVVNDGGRLSAMEQAAHRHGARDADEQMASIVLAAARGAT
jgi:UDP-N-acetylglucosamine--N-acetylmuramyl-(pentapeptide) pyrophosphoryl-undecaprenol N-acetylglucosamine transferase